MTHLSVTLIALALLSPLGVRASYNSPNLWTSTVSDLLVGGKVHDQEKPSFTRTIPTALKPRRVEIEAEVCLSVKLNLLGLAVVDVDAVASLHAVISSKGVSARTLVIAQESLNSQLADAAKGCKKLSKCRDACSADICQGWNYTTSTHTCTLQPQILQPKSSVISDIIANLAQLGPSSPEYCELCPSRCASTPSSMARFKRRSRVPLSLCPEKLDACPISRGQLSRGYECIDTLQELTSCGGCSTIVEGLDCTQVAGVKAAGCEAGRCVAYKCDPGFKLSSNRTCIN